MSRKHGDVFQEIDKIEEAKHPLHVVTVQPVYNNARCTCGAYLGSTLAPPPDNRLLWLHPPHPTCPNAGKLWQPPIWVLEEWPPKEQR